MRDPPSPQPGTSTGIRGTPHQFPPINNEADDFNFEAPAPPPQVVRDPLSPQPGTSTGRRGTPLQFPPIYNEADDFNFEVPANRATPERRLPSPNVSAGSPADSIDLLVNQPQRSQSQRQPGEFESFTTAPLPRNRPLRSADLTGSQQSLLELAQGRGAQGRNHSLNDTIASLSSTQSGQSAAEVAAGIARKMPRANSG